MWSAGRLVSETGVILLTNTRHVLVNADYLWDLPQNARLVNELIKILFCCCFAYIYGVFSCCLSNNLITLTILSVEMVSITIN